MSGADDLGRRAHSTASTCYSLDSQGHWDRCRAPSFYLIFRHIGSAMAPPAGLTAVPDGALGTKLLMVLLKEHGEWWISAYYDVAVTPPSPRKRMRHGSGGSDETHVDHHRCC
jgi:hypothetical protein